MAPAKVQPATTTEADLERLVKMLALLASDQPGERAVAALKVSQFVKTRSIEWSDLVFPPEPAIQPVTVTVGAQTAAQAATVQAQGQINALTHQLRLLQAERDTAKSRMETAEEELRAYRDSCGPMRRHPATGKPWKPMGVPGASTPQGATIGAYSTAPGASRPIPAWGSAQPKPKWVMEVLKMLAAHRHLVRGDREDAFLCDLVIRGKPVLTGKQEGWLRQILARAGLTI